jgi:hypothetical protein
MLTISDKKKHTLEALRQQHAAAKAKKLQDTTVAAGKKKIWEASRGSRKSGVA